MKYKVIKNFTDKYDESIKYKTGKVYDFTEERASEILSVDTFIEKVEEVEEVKKSTKKKK